MSPQTFRQYLEDPVQLARLPLTELQELAVTYPYSPNLRLLLLLKAHLEGHPDEQAYLRRAAAAAFDRSFVYDLLREVRRQTDAEPTEVLELRTLDEIALDDAALLAATPQTEAPPLASALNYDTSLTDVDDYGEPELSVDFPTAAPPAPAEPPAEPVSSGWVASAAAFLDGLPAWPATPAPVATAADVVAPEPVSRFTPDEATGSPDLLRHRLRSIRRQQVRRAAQEGDSVRNIARRSLVSQEAVASETLAQLLVRQGQYQNAIKMYHRLELLYPEKKAIFAGLIKDLQEKL